MANKPADIFSQRKMKEALVKKPARQKKKHVEKYKPGASRS